MSDGAASLGYEELDIHKMELIMASYQGNLAKVEYFMSFIRKQKNL